MSNSGYRGRSFGPRGARTNGPPNGFNGPRFPHATFNHPRPSHRLPGPKFVPWQQNKNFHPQFRGNLQYRPNGQARATGGRGIVRFSVSGRPSLSQFRFVRNPAHAAPTLPREEQVEDKSVLAPQTPLPGSEEERQQKIAETADKLKKKLSSITEEELTNCWEDLSVLPNNEEEDMRNRSIPELRHEPPELDLTFTDFRDIGRIDCNNIKCGNLDSKLGNKISITFDEKLEDNVTSTNNEIITIDESREEPLIILDLCDKDDLKQSNVSVKDDKCQEQIHQCESPDFHCNVENLQSKLQSITGNLTSSNVNNVDEKLSTLNVDENICTNLSPTESVDNSLLEKVLDINDVKTTSTSVLTTNNQDESKIDFSQDQNTVQADIQDQNSDIAQDTDVNIQQNDHIETKLLEDDQIQNDSETNVPREVIRQNLKNVSEEIHLNAVCDPASSTHLNYNEANNKLNDDRKLNNPLAFQSKAFNESPRFTLRTGGPRCHWTFQQNVTNSFFGGSQRLSFYHGNRISLPKHVTIFKPTDLVSVGFDPQTLPPFIHNVPISSHDAQHNSIVPFSSNDLPPAFDPSEPPPNIKSKSGINESSNKQDSLQQSMPLANVSQNASKVTEPPSAFDHRGPPSIRIPYVSVTIGEQIPEFNPQQPPPKIHKRKETLLPPPIFDPRLTSQERSNLIVPLDESRSNAVPLNLMETSSVPDYSISPVTPNFPRLNSSINVPSHRLPVNFMSNVQMNFPSVVSQTSGGQVKTKEFSLRLSPMTITEVPPPAKVKEPSSSVKGNSNPNQGMSMGDGLEDMQEAMEFAKQMNWTEEVKKNRDAPVPESALTLAEIPVPIEIADVVPVTTEERNASCNAKKQRRKESRDKRNRQNVVACGLELSRGSKEKQEANETTDKGQSVESQGKSTEDALLSNDQLRPKVVFNLNTKTKRIQKPEDWHRISLNVAENRETCNQQGTVQNLNKQRPTTRKHHPFESRNNASQISRSQQQKEVKIKRNSDSQLAASGVPTQEKSSNNAQSPSHKSHRDPEKLQGNATSRKSQKPRDEPRKEKALTSESLWKSRVISRFLKMSKNDICNMVNNSSLRKFDIAMKHLVKERKSSLSLELRNVEDEKMKEYDRIEFMNQLNAMLDPSAVVGITDLPTEFIHHLSEVLQLDIPFDDPTTTTTTTTTAESPQNLENSLAIKCQMDTCQEHKLSKTSLGKEDPNHHHHVESSSISNNTNSSHRWNCLAEEPESSTQHKKQQQPLFNEADLDDILSQVAERTRTLSSSSSLTAEPTAERIVAETLSSNSQTVDSNAELTANTERIPNHRSSVTDLDDIFSAGIARARQLGDSNASVDHPRSRKSSSADRNNSSLRHSENRWNRKAREDPDTFRNLTKEEWEAKYGSATVQPPRRNASSSAENLSNRAARRRRHCSSDSPGLARRLSMSPLSRVDVVAAAAARNNNVANDGSNQRIDEEEKSESSSSESSSSSSSFSDSESSFSDSDGEETVAPNVTKLLKVIKENEKIAKNRSLNETIRDEVAAEIEKEWKEKSKHKERRSRKRERRKRDRREKEERRRDKSRRKKRRDSQSDSSRSESRQADDFRLLTQDEIKKEVKQEVNSSLALGIASSSNNNNNNARINEASVDESQCLKEQQVSDLAFNVETQTNHGKPSNVGIPVTTQPKTKAQLKQMPEPNDRKQTTEEVNRDDRETASSCDSEQTDKMDVPPRDTATRQTTPLSSKGQSSTFLQSCNEITTGAIMHATNDNSASNAVVFDSNAPSSTTKANKVNKPGNNYRKIDIKAYKERALQRRSKELEHPRAKSAKSSKSNVENETKKTSKVEITSKDPRLIKARSRSSADEVESTGRELKEKSNSSLQDRQSMDIVELKTKEHSAAARSKFNKEERNRRESKNHAKAPSSSRIPSNKSVDSSKFKNIRSEGNKELKLIKEKNEKKCSRFDPINDRKSSRRLPLIASSLKVTSHSEKVSNHDLSNSRATIINRRTPQKRVDAHSAARGNNNNNNNSLMTRRVNNETIVSSQKEKEKEKEEEEEEEEEENGDDDGNLTKKIESDVTERKQQASINNEAVVTMSVESTLVESSSKRREDVCNEDASPTESIPVEKCMNHAARAFPERAIAREPHHLLSERIDVDIEKHGHRINVKNFKNDEAAEACANCVSEKAGKDVDDERTGETTSKTTTTTARELDDRSGENYSRSDNSEEVRGDKPTTASPSSSPFKGFLVDAVNNDAYQVSRSAGATADDEIVEESSTKVQGETGQRLQTDNQPDNDKSVAEKSDAGSLLAVDAVDDPSVVKDDSVEVGETGNGNEEFLSVAGIENRDTFIEDSEPFIVLDEYIDEKFNCLHDLHAKAVDIFITAKSASEEEECFTRDVRSPNLDKGEMQDATLPREQTTPFADKTTTTTTTTTTATTTNVFPSVSASNVESNPVEAMVVSSKSPAALHSALERIPPAEEYSRNVIDTATKDTYQKDGDTTMAVRRRKSVREEKVGEEREESSQKFATDVAESPGGLVDLPSTARVDKNVGKSVQGRNRSRFLNSVASKPRMKQKKKKRVSASLARVAKKQPTTKEAVMARMIEIDVEIHKLMTEKMTLYQMLTSDEKSLQRCNAQDENTMAESPLTRPRTPSSLMSRLLQNIDAAPPANHCAKDSSISANKSKTLGKHNHHHHHHRHRHHRDTEGEEIGARSAKKRKRQKPERSVKRFDGKLDVVDIGKKQANDNDNGTKSTCKREETRRPATVQTSLLSDQIFSSEATKVEDDDVVENDPSRSLTENGNDDEEEFDGGNCTESAKRIGEEKKNDEKDAESMEKLSESKTPEMLSIYSDDSTWDSFLQSSTTAADDQRKPNTGLALLEETYRKEMAKARRTREKTRRRKRKKLRNLLRTVNALTSDEEQLPLATLYARKLHQKRELLDSFEQRRQETSDPRLWKNVVEVINAVAENRTSDLYAEGPSYAEKISFTEATAVLNSAENHEHKADDEEERKEMARASASKGAKDESSTAELAIISQSKSERNDAETDDTDRRSVTLLPDKSQELPNGEHYQLQDSENHGALKITRDSLDARSTDDIDLAVSSGQQTVASDCIDRTTILDSDDSDSCRICRAESRSSDITDDRNMSNVSERCEKSGGKIDVQTRKSQPKDKRVNVDENIAAVEEKTEEENTDIPVESDAIIADEGTSKNKPPDGSDLELENANESNVQEHPITVEDNGDKRDMGESNRPPEGYKHFANVREQKEPRKRKDTEARSGEENNNQSSSSSVDSAEALKGGEAFLGKKLLKHKRASSKTVVRRSSRYNEEPAGAKRIKVEADTAVTVAKQDEKNFGTRSRSPCEELQQCVLVNAKKCCRSVQRPAANRKRCTPTLFSETEVAPHEPSGESSKQLKRHKKHTICEMMNCMVRLVDCRRTILKPTNVSRKYGVTRVNQSVHCVNCPEKTDALASSTQSTTTLTKESPCESPQSQTSRPMGKIDHAAPRCVFEQITSTTADKVNRATKTAKVDLLPVNDTEESCENPDIDVMPVLVNELVTMDIARNCEKSDVEIVEERVRVVKNNGQHNSDSESPTAVIDKEDKEQARTQYTVHKGPILDIKVFENSFLAASEDGRIYRYNQASNGILNIYKGHKAAVTCLYVYNVISTDIGKEWMFSGSLDGTLRCYNIKTGVQVRDTADIGSPVQCMNEAWGIIFIGTKSGHVLRYHMKTGVIKGDSIQFSDKSVLALKATNEGPRRVLIVASRSQPITIRDAQSGLFLRTICGQKSHTVYSLMRNDNLIYCGTSSTSIPVFDFTNGEQTMQYNAGVGIVCMRLYKQLLFAGCYDGNIYVFDTKDHQFVCSVPGPGNMLLSMEVVDNKIIAGSKDKRLQSWQMPRQVRSLLQKVNQA